MERRPSPHRAKSSGAPMPELAQREKVKRCGVHDPWPRMMNVGRKRPGSRAQTSRLSCPKWLLHFGHWVKESELGHWLAALSRTQKVMLVLEVALGILLIGLLSQLHLGLPCLLVSVMYWLFQGPLHEVVRRVLCLFGLHSRLRAPPIHTHHSERWMDCRQTAR